MRRERRRIEPINAGLTDDVAAQLAEFARRLQQKRAEAQISMSELARMVWGETTEPRTGKKVARGRDIISRWESGTRAPSELKLRDLCNKTGWSYEELAPSMMAGKVDLDASAILSVRMVRPGEMHIRINRMVPSAIGSQIISLLEKAGEEPCE